MKTKYKNLEIKKKKVPPDFLLLKAFKITLFLDFNSFF